MSSAFVVAAFLTASGLGAPGGVVLTEIHFNPPAAVSAGGEGRGQEKGLEFVEAFNAGPDAVSLDGWTLSGGVEFSFPAGQVLAPGEFLVVGRDPELLEVRFGASGGLLLGPWEGTLDNGSERVVLLDGDNAYVDSFTYEDDSPWPQAADGDGESLQRVCTHAPTRKLLNWRGGLPTPLAASLAAACPLPAEGIPPVVINEIYYHPPRTEEPFPSDEDGESSEFVELHNASDQAVNVRGWRFTGGIDFAFPTEGDTVIPPRGYLVVARDAAALRELYSVPNLLGDFDGKLSNSGERLTLEDANGNIVESLRYEDAGAWPTAADGRGRSLERVRATASGDHPGNWASSVVRPFIYLHLSGEGRLRGTPQERFVFAVNGPGEFLIDNVVVEDLANPGTNLLSNGAFEDGLLGWTVAGTAELSAVLPDGGVGGNQALRLITTGPCPADLCGTANGVSATLPSGLERDTTYRVSFDIQYIAGETSAFSGGIFLGASAVYDTVVSPGLENTVGQDGEPFVVSDVKHFPQEPTPADRVWVTARVDSADPATVVDAVTLLHNGGVVGVDPETPLPLFDDGLHRDGAAGDGVYGVELPAFPANTRLHFRILADSGASRFEFPRPFELGVTNAFEVWGYYVSDFAEASDLPTYHLLIDEVDGSPSQVNGFLRCTILRSAWLAVEGDLYPIQVRFRGNTMCVVDKRNFKVRFEQGRQFRGLDKLNFNSMWTDKALLREHLSWEFIRELGLPYSSTEYVRVHVSGQYYGLYLCLEHPDERFLERNELNSNGNLFKAKQPVRPEASPVGVDLPLGTENWGDLWEQETNEGNDFGDLAEFVGSMHLDGRAPNQPSVEFWAANSFEDMIVDYQVGQVVLNNIDSFAKNHFLFHDTAAKRWGFMTWDLDLTFGKFFAPCAVSPAEGRQVGTLNDILLCNPQPNRPEGCSVPPQLNPWFASTVLDEVRRNWVVDLFFNAGDGHYQRAYLARLWSVLQEKFRGDVYEERLDSLVVALAEEAQIDFELWGRYPTNVPGTPEDMLSHVEILKEQIRCHRNFLLQFVTENHPAVPLTPRVKITEILYKPEDGNSEFEFIELRNFEARSVDISGWTLEEGIEFTFPRNSRLAAGETIVLAKSPEVFSGRHSGLSARLFGPYDKELADGGETLLLRDAGPGYPAIIDALRYSDDDGWPLLRAGFSLEFEGVKSNQDNDLPEHWEVSSSIGGTPGSFDQSFVRGDANADARIDLSDPLFIANWLFVDGATPTCLDAADMDDSGWIDLTDSVSLLNFMFLNGPAPAPPYPLAGADETVDTLSCLD